MLIIPPGYIQIYAYFTNVVGHPCQNGCAFSVAAPLDQAAVDGASDILAPVYKNQLSSSSVFSGVKIYEGQDGLPLVWESSSSSGAGSRGGAFHPPQVQGLIRKSSTLFGRQGRGRMFIPDMYESQVDDSGHVTGAGATLLTDIAHAWFTTIGADTTAYLLHSNATPPTPLTAIQGQIPVATQRRRYPR